MTVNPIVPADINTPTENTEAEPVTTDTSTTIEIDQSYMTVPSVQDSSMIYFVVLGAVLVTYAIANLIVKAVSK